jgi:regulator of replication initiation timing
LKNGHPAQVFTNEDRRKAAAITNEIRRERAETLALELENQALERRLAVVEARRRRKSEYARRRRERLRAEAKKVVESAAAVPAWFADGYPSPLTDSSSAGPRFESWRAHLRLRTLS